MKISERGVAVLVLVEVLENGAYANIALRKAFADEKVVLDARGRAFVTEIVNQTLRNLIAIDFIINAFSKLPVEEMKPLIRNLLRVAICQLRFMDKIPDFALVNEAVELAKAHGFSGLSGFVNGMLRSAVREPEKPKFPPTNLCLNYSYPVWLRRGLINWLGEERAWEFCKASHVVPGVSVVANPLRASVENLAVSLENEGMEVETIYEPSALRLKRTANLTESPSFRAGHFYVVDPGAMLSVRAMGVKPGMNVIDLCAAPGGKTFALAGMMQDKCQIEAFDLHEHRVKLIESGRRRLGLRSIVSHIADALQLGAGYEGWADALLLDAPCSGLGIIRKNPEIKFTRRLEDIKDLAAKQRQLLTAAAKYVKPGGVLVYSTCTVTSEENLENAEWFLKNFPFEAEDIGVDESLMPPSYIRQGSGASQGKFIQLMPGADNDAFFVARFRRV